ncbi:coiled-coil domain-containing protein 183-like [Rhynochetos jubatus]
MVTGNNIPTARPVRSAGVWQLEGRARHGELCSVRVHCPAAAAPSTGAAMVASQAKGMEGQGRTAAAAQGQRRDLGWHVQELRASVGLQGRGEKLSWQVGEEKLRENRERLPPLRETVRRDVDELSIAQKRNELSVAAVRGAQKPLAVVLARKTEEEAQEKLRHEIYERAKKCNVLLHQLSQRSGTLDKLQRQLQRLTDAEPRDEQPQVLRRLENSIEETLARVQAGERVTDVYLALRDALRKELAQLSLPLDLLCGTAKRYQRELEDLELTASDARNASDVTKVDVAKTRSRILAERELRYRALEEQKVPIDRSWRKEARERHLRAQGRYELATDVSSRHLQDPLGGTELEASKSQREYEAWVVEKMERAKAVMQCSRLWDVPARLLEQQNSSGDLEQLLRELTEEAAVLEKTLRELELQRDELKFHQAPNTTRMLEEELRANLKREEARLEQMRAQARRNQESLLDFESGVDHLFTRLHGISVPGQDSIKAGSVEEKLQQCGQKLRYLTQRVADLPPSKRSLDEDNEIFVKVRSLLESKTAKDTEKVKVSLEDAGSQAQDPADSEGQDLVLTREDIKKQGLRLIESRKKGSKK